jgi:hypothetical protein
MRRAIAYKFKSSLTLGQIYDRLNAHGSWRWYERDSDAWGYYISASPAAGSQVKILKDPEDRSLAVNFNFVSEDETSAEARFAELGDDLRERILPAIDATDIVPAATYE